MEESDICVCGHTRNFHWEHQPFFGGETQYTTCSRRITEEVGNKIFLMECPCQRFGLAEGASNEGP